MRPLIALPAREVVNQAFPYAPRIQGQQITYVKAVIRAGGVPIIIPIVENLDVLRQQYDLTNGLLLAGGNDIDPALYGAKRSSKTEDVQRKRDDQEVQLLKWALEDDKPVLAICRGMQLLNVHLGGSLYQDIEADIPDAHNHDYNTEPSYVSRIVHNLKIEPNSRLSKILDSSEIGANAYHHQAVKEIGQGLVATAWAEDEIIEALELNDKKFVLGVQTHPESLEDKIEPRWRKLFEAFVDASKA